MGRVGRKLLIAWNQCEQQVAWFTSVPGLRITINVQSSVIEKQWLYILPQKVLYHGNLTQPMKYKVSYLFATFLLVLTALGMFRFEGFTTFPMYILSKFLCVWELWIKVPVAIFFLWRILTTCWCNVNITTISPGVYFSVMRCAISQ